MAAAAATAAPLADVAVAVALPPFVDPSPAAPVMVAVAVAGVIEGAFTCCACGVCFRAMVGEHEPEVFAPEAVPSFIVADCLCCCPPFISGGLNKCK